VFVLTDKKHKKNWMQRNSIQDKIKEGLIHTIATKFKTENNKGQEIYENGLQTNLRNWTIRNN
jgi:hypothetical protein